MALLRSSKGQAWKSTEKTKSSSNTFLKEEKKKTKYCFLKCIKALINIAIYNYRLNTFILDLFPRLRSVCQAILERNRKTEAEKTIQYSALHPARLDKTRAYVVHGPTL